jgi:hypothetical protein
LIPAVGALSVGAASRRYAMGSLLRDAATTGRHFTFCDPAAHRVADNHCDFAVDFACLVVQNPKRGFT